MEAVESLAGLIFVGGVLVGLLISIFTLRGYYDQSLRKNIEEYRKIGRKEIESYKVRIEELERELAELKGEEE